MGLSERERRLEQELKAWLKDARKVVIIGVGNPIRMDDFVGMKIVQDLKEKVSNDKIMLVEAERVPEDHLVEILVFEPSHVLFIDAAVLDLQPGDTKFEGVEFLKSFSPFSTHMLPLRVFCDHLQKATDADVRLLLIEPRLTDFGEGLSPEIEDTRREITSILAEILIRLS
jgi:hydrogenase 3 maturation protease